jgi:hypothetical protein
MFLQTYIFPRMEIYLTLCLLCYASANSKHQHCPTQVEVSLSKVSAPYMHKLSQLLIHIFMLTAVLG